MPSAIDQRRLNDGVVALRASEHLAETDAEIRLQLAIVSEGLAALQSLDDLGPQANAQAFIDQQELWKRYKALKSKLDKLEGKTQP